MLRSSVKRLTQSSLQVPVPWGHISAKKFNRLDKSATQKPTSTTIDKSLPFLCFHGWLDNANTFDKLIPLIQIKHPDTEFICFDWPGHGRSSPRPDGCYFDITANVGDIYRVVKHLGLLETGFNSMCHSLGGNCMTHFNCAFPNINRNYIRIESDGFTIYRSDNFRKLLQTSIAAQVQYDSKVMAKKEEKGTTYAKARDRLSRGSYFGERFVPSTILGDSLDVILERGLTELPGKFDPESGEQLYKFSRDLKNVLNTLPTQAFSLNDILPVLESGYKICRHNELAIQAHDTVWAPIFLDHEPAMWDCWEKNLPYKHYSQNPNFQMVSFDGTHHLHLNNPERLSGKICDWIQDPSDRTGAIDDLRLRELRIPEQFRPTSK